MRLQDIMRTDVVTVEATQSASNAWTRMRQQRIRHLPVTDNGQLVGIVSERDLGGPRGQATRRGRTVGDLMTTRVVSASPKTTLRQAANLMRSRQIGSLLVTDENDQLVGIVTATDVLDELGRGFVRPAVMAERRPLRSPPPDRTKPGAKAPVLRRAPAGKKKVGRTRPRKPESKTRAAMASQLPKVSKVARDRTSTAQIPTYIRAVGKELGEDERTYIRWKLGTKLGKFVKSIERVSVRIEDVNGPKGGIDQACRIKVVLSNLPSVLFETQDAFLHAAVDQAISGIERNVRRALQRHRTKPLHKKAA